VEDWRSLKWIELLDLTGQEEEEEEEEELNLIER